MQSVNNLDIRLLVSKLDLTYKSIARQMGCSRVYLSRIMGQPLKVETKERILKAIDELLEKGEQR